MSTIDRRAWFKPHFSTWLVALAALAALTLIVVPGGVSAPVIVDLGIVGPTYYAHGWPCVWLDRGVNTPAAPPIVAAEITDIRERPTNLVWGESGDIDWIHRNAWPLTGTFYLRWKGLLLDLCVVIVITSALCGGWEFWRRQRFQFGTRFLLVLVLLVSLAMAYWRTAAVRWSRETELIAKLEDVNVATNTVSAAPDWLCRLVGSRRFPSFVTELNFSNSGSDPERDLDQALAVARGFSKLNTLRLDFPNDRELEILATHFADAKSGRPLLRELEIDVGGDMSDAGYRAVARLSGLRWLTIVDTTKTGLEQLKSLAHLEELVLDRGEFTRQDIDALQKALPTCEIEWTEPSAPPEE